MPGKKIVTETDILDEKERGRIIGEILRTEATDRKREAERRTQCMNDGVSAYVLDQLSKEFDDKVVAEMANRIPNVGIVKKIINKLARVYKIAPKRSVTGPTPKKRQKLLDGLVKALDLNRQMKDTNRKVELHRNAAVGVLPFLDRKEMIKSGDDGNKWAVGLEILTPLFFDVIEDPVTKTRANILIFSYPVNDVQSSNLSKSKRGDGVSDRIADNKKDKTKDGETRTEYVWWSDHFHFTTDGKGVATKVPFEDEDTFAKQARNPIGRLPYILFNKGQEMEFWARGGEDLVDNAILINQLLADLYFAMKFQGSGYFYMFGKDVPKEQKVGPNRMIVVNYEKEDPTPVIGFASPNFDTAAHRDTIEQLVALTLTTNNLEPGAIRGKLEAGEMKSGIQELIQRSEPSTAIEDEQELYIQREPEVVEVALAWIKFYNENGSLSPRFVDFVALGDEVDYSLTLGDPSAFTSEKERLENAKTKKELGVITQVGVVKEVYPDMTDEEAVQRVAEVEAEDTERKKKNVAEFGLPPNPNDKEEEEAKNKPPKPGDNKKDE